jgi:hypothetical protein
MRNRRSSGSKVRRAVAALAAVVALCPTATVGAAVAPGEVGDALAGARSLGGGPSAVVDGTFDSAVDVDVFRFTGTTSAWSFVLVTTDPQRHPGLEILDRDGVVVLTTVATSGTVVSASGSTLGASDRFYLRAYGTGSYRLTMRLDVGALRVVTSPPVPAVIRVGPTTADQWSVNWRTVPAGDQLVCFMEVAGYTEPDCAQPHVDVGGTTTVVGAYRPRGWLRVQTDPPVASTIRVDGVVRNDWGMWTDLDPGTYEVCYGAVAGFDPPPCQTVHVEPGATTDVVGRFGADPAALGERSYGLLRVATSPPVPAQILVDDRIADSWSLNWVKVAPGRHSVCFRRVAGYEFRPCMVAEVEEGGTTVLTAEFHQRGVLRVLTDPPLPASISIDGGRRDNWGFWSEYEAGWHEVCFGEVIGFVAPPCRQALVSPGETTAITAFYENEP